MNLAVVKDLDIQRENESEFTPLQSFNEKNTNKKEKTEITNTTKINYNLIILFVLILTMFIITIYQHIIMEKERYELENPIIDISQFEVKQEGNEKNNIIKNDKNDSITTIKNDSINIGKNITRKNEKNLRKKEEKIGVAFIYHILHSNGVARVISLTSDYLIKTGKYNVYLITGKPTAKDYKYDNRIKRFACHDNRTLIRSLRRELNIKYFVLNNQLTESLIKFLQSLNSYVVGIFHGVYLSAIFHNNTNSYRTWYKFDFYNAFIAIAADDLYFYKKLGYKNATFIPNLYTFEPSESPESNLTYNNIVMLGRAHDKIKGSKYAIKAMSYIVKEVPDAHLIFASSDKNVKELENLAKNYSISQNIIFKFFPNISEIFLNSSVLMFTSLCEAFPMAMNEGKAYGLPVVAFNIPFSMPFQTGVITVPHLDVEALAKETIKLLKDYNYRKKKGREAKLSLNRFNNNDTINLWLKLFDSLDKGYYRKFQEEMDNKYYNEETAREHVLMHYNSALRFNKYFRCHKFDDMLKMKYIRNIKNCTNVT